MRVTGGSVGSGGRAWVSLGCNLRSTCRLVHSDSLGMGCYVRDVSDTGTCFAAAVFRSLSADRIDVRIIHRVQSLAAHFATVPTAGAECLVVRYGPKDVLAPSDEFEVIWVHTYFVVAEMIWLKPCRYLSNECIEADPICLVRATLMLGRSAISLVVDLSLPFPAAGPS